MAKKVTKKKVQKKANIKKKTQKKEISMQKKIKETAIEKQKEEIERRLQEMRGETVKEPQKIEKRVENEKEIKKEPKKEVIRRERIEENVEEKEIKEEKIEFPRRIEKSSEITQAQEIKNAIVNQAKIEEKQEEEKFAPKVRQIERGENAESYEIIVDDAKVRVDIEKVQKGYTYNLEIPKIGEGTEALLTFIRKELTSITTIAVGEIVDQKSINRIKQQFISDAKRLINEKVPTIESKKRDTFVGLLMQEMLGLGKVEFLINDPHLEEIVIIGSKEPIRVYHKNYGWLATNIFPKSEDEVLNYSNIIARRIGRQISILNPLLDAHVVTGDRSNTVLYPISTKGHTITIRKFARDPWTIVDLIKNNTLHVDIAALLWIAFEYEMNVIISGGTGSGKTVILNACMPFMPPNHRIISMEDTRELTLPEFLYWCPLVTRSANAEGKGEVSMLDLLVNSLRMRPDRIVLGEIRRQREAEVLFEAMHTGHSVYATLHADTANETIRRLTHAPINIPPSMLNSVNLNVVMFRDRKRGYRRALQVAEFISGKNTVSANVIQRWIPETDKFTEHNKSMAFFDTLSRHTGMSQKDIEKNIEEKTKILNWLIKNNIRNLESIGKVMNTYYTDREKLQHAMKTNKLEGITRQEKVM